MRHQHTRRPFRPAIEALEVRTLLSICTVDRLNDLDEGTGDRGSLRYCVIESLFRADIINFEVTGVINLTRALPDLIRSVRIEGPGSELMTVRWNSGNALRIFTVTTGVTASISGLTITIGTGLRGGGIDNSGTLTISDCAITGNTFFVLGGGISSSGSLTVINSRISGNIATLQGGGIYNTGRLTITDSTISGNSAISGGGIRNNGTLTVNNSTVSGNSAPGEEGGGGILNSRELTVSNSTISGNSAVFGGGIRNYGPLPAVISNSTISTNSAVSGGGIDNNGTLVVSNSTISGNTSSHGAGVFNRISLTISNNTFTDNRAEFQGGGIYVVDGAMVAARNTIIAGNTAQVGPDVRGNLGSRGYNLIGTPVDMTGWVVTDLLHVNPRLGPLQDNGGPTRTHALLSGSPAINAANPAAGSTLGSPKWDQRGDGYWRIAGGRLDIGAFEVQGRAEAGGEADLAGELSWLAGVRKRPTVG